jgi:hypothetical protein
MSAGNRRQKIADSQNIENLDSHKKDTGQNDTISPQLTLDLAIMGVKNARKTKRRLDTMSRLRHITACRALD